MNDDEIDRMIAESESVLRQFENSVHVIRAAIEKWIDAVGPEHPLRREAVEALVAVPQHKLTSS